MNKSLNGDVTFGAGSHSHSHYDSASASWSPISIADTVIVVKGSRVSVLKDRNGEFTNLPEIDVNKAIITGNQIGSHKHRLSIKPTEEMYSTIDVITATELASEIIARVFLGEYKMDSSMLKELIKQSLNHKIIETLKNFEVVNEF